MKNNKGFTLVEVLVSIALVAVLMIPVANYFNTSIKLGRQSKQVVQATYIAQKYMETEKKSTVLEEGTMNYSDGVYDVLITTTLWDLDVDADDVFVGSVDTVDYGEGDDIINAVPELVVDVSLQGDEVIKISDGNTLRLDSNSVTITNPTITLTISGDSDIDYAIQYDSTENNFNYGSLSSGENFDITCNVVESSPFTPYLLKIRNLSARNVRVYQFGSTENLKVETINSSTGSISVTKNLIDAQLKSDTRDITYLVNVKVSIEGRTLEEIESLVRIKN